MYIYKKNTKKWCQKGVVPIEGDVEGVALSLDLAEPLTRLQHHPQDREASLLQGCLARQK